MPLARRGRGVAGATLPRAVAGSGVPTPGGAPAASSPGLVAAPAGAPHSPAPAVAMGASHARVMAAPAGVVQRTPSTETAAEFDEIVGPPPAQDAAAASHAAPRTAGPHEQPAPDASAGSRAASARTSQHASAAEEPSAANEPAAARPQPSPAPAMQTHRVSDATLQRAMAAFSPPPAITPVHASDVSVVQRAPDDFASSTDAPSQVDLNAIAREVYPILRRMLEVDRERRTRF